MADDAQQHPTPKELPHQLIEELGRLLDPKSLAAARSTCRTWRHHISRWVKVPGTTGGLFELSLSPDALAWQQRCTAMAAALPSLQALCVFAGGRVGTPAMDQELGVLATTLTSLTRLELRYLQPASAKFALAPAPGASSSAPAAPPPDSTTPLPLPAIPSGLSRLERLSHLCLVMCGVPLAPQMQHLPPTLKELRIATGYDALGLTDATMQALGEALPQLTHLEADVAPWTVSCVGLQALPASLQVLSCVGLLALGADEVKAMCSSLPALREVCVEIPTDRHPHALDLAVRHPSLVSMELSLNADEADLEPAWDELLATLGALSSACCARFGRSGRRAAEGWRWSHDGDDAAAAADASAAQQHPQHRVGSGALASPHSPPSASPLRDSGGSGSVDTSQQRARSGGAASSTQSPPVFSSTANHTQPEDGSALPPPPAASSSGPGQPQPRPTGPPSPASALAAASSPSQAPAPSCTAHGLTSLFLQSINIPLTTAWSSSTAGLREPLLRVLGTLTSLTSLSIAEPWLSGAGGGAVGVAEHSEAAAPREAQALGALTELRGLTRLKQLMVSLMPGFPVPQLVVTHAVVRTLASCCPHLESLTALHATDCHPDCLAALGSLARLDSLMLSPSQAAHHAPSALAAQMDRPAKPRLNVALLPRVSLLSLSGFHLVAEQPPQLQQPGREGGGSQPDAAGQVPVLPPWLDTLGGLEDLVLSDCALGAGLQPASLLLQATCGSLQSLMLHEVEGLDDGALAHPLVDLRRLTSLQVKPALQLADLAAGVVEVGGARDAAAPGRAGAVPAAFPWEMSAPGPVPSITQQGLAHCSRLTALKRLEWGGWGASAQSPDEPELVARMAVGPRGLQVLKLAPARDRHVRARTAQVVSDALPLCCLTSD